MNAKKEFLDVTKNYKVLCATLLFYSMLGCRDEDEDGVIEPIVLKLEYTQEDLNIFLKHIDQQYDNGYGGQQLYGTIWCSDGVWFERGEYDGSEWWESHQYPQIPDNLR